MTLWHERRSPDLPARILKHCQDYYNLRAEHAGIKMAAAGKTPEEYDAELNRIREESLELFARFKP